MLDLTWPLRRHIDVFAGVARYASEHGRWSCVVDDFAEDTIAEHRGPGRPYEGVIARVTPRLAEVARRRRLPLVNVWMSSPVKGLPAVLPDGRAAGALVAEHLIDRGIRQAVCLVRHGDKSEYETSNVVARRVREAGGACSILRVSLRFAHNRARWRETRGALEAFLRDSPLPVGIYAGVDILGRLVAQTCADLGLHVPGDAAVIAGGNEPTLCHYPEPSLTSLDYGYDRIGYEAARLMDSLLAGDPPPTAPLLLPPRELVVRHSSDFLYVADAVVMSAMRFIASHSSKPISVDDVAEAAGVSRRTLESRFKSNTDRSVAAEIRRVRIEHAKRLLAAEDLSIAEVAKIAGFKSNAQLCRVFQNELNTSPRAYRRQRQLHGTTAVDETLDDAI